MTWESMSPAEQAEICEALDVLGEDLAVSIAVESSDGTVNPQSLRELLRREC